MSTTTADPVEEATETIVGTFESYLANQWVEQLAIAYQLARGERLHQLRTGRHHRAFDDRGLHPLSIVIGQIQLLERLLELPAECCLDSRELRDVAESQAYIEFRDEVARERLEELAPNAQDAAPSPAPGRPSDVSRPGAASTTESES